MMKRMKFAVVFFSFLLQAIFSFSQNDSLKPPHHIALFTPLYLDSAFDATSSYRYGKQFPKFINPGLEFWEGAKLAIDSLQKEGVQLEIHVYDTRASKKKFESLLMGEEMKGMDMLIGHVGVNEASLLARLADTLNIPFINVNLPNDAGVTHNHNYIILNSTLATHCTGIYKFLQTNFALSSIVMFTKKGQTEEKLKNYFANAEKFTASVPLKIKTVILPDSFRIEQLTKHLDPDITNVCLVGSLDINFGQNISQKLSSVTDAYTSTVIGMPTWDLIDFTRPGFKEIEIIYSSPFYTNPEDKLVESVNEFFKTKFYSRPTDMVFRGYETVYHFAHLLLSYDKNIGSNLSDKKNKLFTDFDIQPVINKQTNVTEYFENRKLYFIKKVDGVVKAVY